MPSAVRGGDSGSYSIVICTTRSDVRQEPNVAGEMTHVFTSSDPGVCHDLMQSGAPLGINDQNRSKERCKI